jgi:ATP synthase, Delta/Epsilon chain, beta-sandwich domain
VDSVVVPGAEGEFGVLPLHVALMTEIAFSILLICNIISLSSDGVYLDSTEEDLSVSESESFIWCVIIISLR